MRHIWLGTRFDEDEPSILKGLSVTNEQAMIPVLVNYAKRVSNEKVKKLEKVDIEEMLNFDNDAPVVHSMSDGKIDKRMCAP